jgi:hypothetical protein
MGILLLLCCALPFLFLEGSLLPFKPCLPVSYPNGTPVRQPEGARIVYTTTHSLAEVTMFYDKRLANLQRSILGTEVGKWEKETSENQVDYSCYGNDINRLTTETGCISLSELENKTVIETTRLRSEGGNTPCPFHRKP